MVKKYSPSNPQVVKKWSPSGHQAVTDRSLSGYWAPEIFPIFILKYFVCLLGAHSKTALFMSTNSEVHSLFLLQQAILLLSVSCPLYSLCVSGQLDDEENSQRPAVEMHLVWRGTSLLHTTFIILVPTIITISIITTTTHFHCICSWHDDICLDKYYSQVFSNRCLSWRQFLSTVPEDTQKLLISSNKTRNIVII